jgi:hypothetical protein
MESHHRTHFLFLHPKNPPSKEPIEDDISKKVDFIYAQLKPGCSYRGWHNTPWGASSHACDYIHPTFPIISNSLAPYYIRHHRQDLTEKQIAWIHELYNILKMRNYYQIKKKQIYYFKTYERMSSGAEYDMGYRDALTYVVKIIGTKEGVLEILSGTFFRELTESEFIQETKQYNEKFDMERDGCQLVEVYDVLKRG